ncbi:TonB-dependent heme receptor A [Rhynchospora pubera]|uniref:TonB-dependent heme receptor A n=1 Tax=Rhynchospora pubera TaxID=906938 RepID=A0AAV8FBA7_9POAL|nr:TonB-dependent heme receptor A [Rhynchospora pubera]
MALNRSIQSGLKLFAASEAALSKSATRSLHATAHDEPYYLHAKHMYNLHRMKNQKLKMYLSVAGAVGIGVVVPLIAVDFMQKKTASG